MNLEKIALVIFGIIVISAFFLAITLKAMIDVHNEECKNL